MHMLAYSACNLFTLEFRICSMQVPITLQATDEDQSTCNYVACLITDVTQELIHFEKPSHAEASPFVSNFHKSGLRSFDEAKYQSRIVALHTCNACSPIACLGRGYTSSMLYLLAKPIRPHAR